MAYPQTLGQYRLLKRIARGGMGEVWSAEPLEGGGEKVAVKTMLSPEDADTMSLAKFIGEARIGAAVSDHPHMVKTIDLGLEGERMFLVMELLDGRPLSQLARGAQLPPEAAVGIALPVLSALEHAQTAPGPNGEALNLVHRDLKPGNLFVCKSGVVKVIDFGIALASGLDQTTTRTGLIRGSVAYVSPEQARGERSDGRSDVYSLAVVMHELLTGKRLFDQQSDAARLSAILFGEVPDLRKARPEVPEAFGATIKQALARDVADRPVDAAAFAEALRQSILPKAPWSPADIAAWAATRPATPQKQHATGPIALNDASPKAGVKPLRPADHIPSASMAGLADERLTSRDLAPVNSPRLDRVSRLLPMLLVAFGAAVLVGIGLFALTTSPESDAAPPPAPVVARAKAPQPKPELEPKTVAQPEPEPEPVAVPAPAPVPSPVAPAPVAVKPVAPKPKPKPAEVVSSATVHVTVDSRPTWANVSVDGKVLGPTPLVRVLLPVSSRTLTAVNPEGKKKSVKLKLVEGKDEKVLLEW